MSAGGPVPRRSMLIALAAPALAKDPRMVKIAEFDAAGNLIGVREVPKIAKPDAEWKAQLGGASYTVARRKGTEFAFTGRFNKHKEDGVYTCICCGTALFDSTTKFNSGTGWPSFWAPIAKENIRVERDFSLGMIREEVLCARCDAHLGHVFPDGPEPTGLRYCINSVSLSFQPRAR